MNTVSWYLEEEKTATVMSQSKGKMAIKLG